MVGASINGRHLRCLIAELLGERKLKDHLVRLRNHFSSNVLRIICGLTGILHWQSSASSKTVHWYVRWLDSLLVSRLLASGSLAHQSSGDSIHDYVKVFDVERDIVPMWLG